LVVLRYSCAINDYDLLQLSKLDILSTFDKIRVAIAYKSNETGVELSSFPADQSLLESVEVVYHELPGWNTSIANVREWRHLPKEAQDYVEFIENFIHTKVCKILIRDPPKIS
jgi:adenylosuccinate synthase